MKIVEDTAERTAFVHRPVVEVMIGLLFLVLGLSVIISSAAQFGTGVTRSDHLVGGGFFVAIASWLLSFISERWTLILDKTKDRYEFEARSLIGARGRAGRLSELKSIIIQPYSLGWVGGRLALRLEGGEEFPVTRYYYPILLRLWAFLRMQASLEAAKRETQARARRQEA